MRLKCTGLISDYKDVFSKGALYEASTMKNGFCDVHGGRTKRNGTPWTGVLSLGKIVVLGVAKFEIVTEEGDDTTTDKDDAAQTV